MEIYPNKPDIQKMWRMSPLRISGPYKSKCHDMKTILMQTSSGGFVKQFCDGCGKEQTLSNEEFEQLEIFAACPKCKKLMRKEMIDANYGIVCNGCDIGIFLASLLPEQDIA